MDDVRFKHFATQQMISRKRCPSDNNNPCAARDTNLKCIECADRYFQALAETEREDM